MPIWDLTRIITEKSGLPEDEAKDAEDEVQKITDSYNKKIDEILTAKEKDIMTI